MSFGRVHENPVIDAALWVGVAVFWLMGPMTFLWRLIEASDWTLLNALPRLLWFALTAAVWFLYWPLRFIFG